MDRPEHALWKAIELIENGCIEKEGMKARKFVEGNKERRDWDVKTRLLSSIEKAKTLLGYEPQIGFEDGLKKVHEWFVENWENVEQSAEF